MKEGGITKSGGFLFHGKTQKSHLKCFGLFVGLFVTAKRNCKLNVNSV
jgi:hypothetical protein